MRIPGLVKKEVVSHFRRVDASVWTAFSSAALTVLGAAIIAALIGYVTYTVDAKMLEAASSSAPYLIALFLFIFAAFNCVDGALRARRTFYSESDREIVNPLPYKPYEIVLSKTIFLWLYQIAEGALLSLPVLLVFGINRDYGAGYYVVSVIYCLVIPTMVTGASLILSVVFQWVYRWMRGHDLIQFLLAAVVVVGLCFIYALFLRLFLASLSQESDISGALPGAFMENLEHITSFMPPVYHFIDLWISGAHQFVNIMVLLLCGLALPAGGYFLSLWYYQRWDRGLAAGGRLLPLPLVLPEVGPWPGQPDQGEKEPHLSRLHQPAAQGAYPPVQGLALDLLLHLAADHDALSGLRGHLRLQRHPRRQHVGGP